MPWNDDRRYHITTPEALQKALKARKARIFNLQAVKSDPQHIRYIPVPLKQAGVYVDHDVALRFSAVFRAVCFISQTIASLPWDILLETAMKTQKQTGHPLWKLLRTRPNPEMGAQSFRETLLAWALSWGNGYAEIEKDKTGTPVALWPISPDRVEAYRDPESGNIRYDVSNYMGGIQTMRPENLFHLHGLGFDGLTGYSVISFASRSIGLGMAAEGYAGDFFANGAISTGALKHPNTLSDLSRKNLRESWASIIQGEGKRFNIPIFEEGMDWVNLMINPEDAQLLLTREFQITDIARWFGLPPHKLQDLSRATWGNIEHLSIEVVNDALMPWIIRLEQEADFKLLRPTEKGVRTKLNVRGLLRGDDKSRSEYYKIMRDIGVYSTNDIRRLEDMDPVGPEGDELIVQLNQTTLKKLVSGEAPAPKPAPPLQSYKMLIQHAYERILKREIGQFERDGAPKGDFSAWFNQFFAKERGRIEQDMEPIVMSLLLQIAPQIEINGQIPEILAGFIDWHIEASRNAFSAPLAGKVDEFCTPERVKEGANRLIEALAAMVVEAKEKPNALPE
jgi:HK97 family phage portal protein